MDAMERRYQLVGEDGSGLGAVVLDTVDNLDGVWTEDFGPLAQLVHRPWTKKDEAVLGFVQGARLGLLAAGLDWALD